MCGRPDKFDFTVPEDLWVRVVPHPFSDGVVCMFCFDALAEVRCVDYADQIKELWLNA